MTDRFLRELGPIAAGQVPKDSDFKFETLVKRSRYIQIKVGSSLAFGRMVLICVSSFGHRNVRKKVPNFSSQFSSPSETRMGTD